MGFRKPQALVVPSLHSGYYTSAFRFLKTIDISKTVSNNYIVTAGVGEGDLWLSCCSGELEGCSAPDTSAWS